MSVDIEEYEYEEFREFFIRRQFLVGNHLMTHDIWDRIKARKPFVMGNWRWIRLNAFIAGYLTAKGGI